MPGETDVVNVALRRIGASRIVSLTDGSKSANAADDVYTEIRDDLLRSHRWNFATKRKKLAQSSTTPTFEFDFAYPLPSDWLRTVSVHDNDAGGGAVLYRMELNAGVRSLLASRSELWLRYVSRVTDTNLMPLDFRIAFEFKLAAALAIPLASSNTLEDTMTKKADRVTARARSADAMGSFPESRPRGSWANSRGGGRRRDHFN
ncbi:MAG TPA: hypothetical protein ENH82_02250 [bacterium]|nr:hypothetical protein [bacterium]